MKAPIRKKAEPRVTSARVRDDAFEGWEYEVIISNGRDQWRISGHKLTRRGAERRVRKLRENPGRKLPSDWEAV